MLSGYDCSHKGQQGAILRRDPLIDNMGREGWCDPDCWGVDEVDNARDTTDGGNGDAGSA